MSPAVDAGDAREASRAEASRAPTVGAGAQDAFVGAGALVPLAGGGRRSYVDLDQAASTPALCAVRDAVEALLPWYGSVHRGSGYKSRVSSRALEDARDYVLHGLGGRPDEHLALFVRGATEGLNLLANRLVEHPDDVVITTEMEHHANLLPWTARGRVLYAPVSAGGSVDPAAIQDAIDRAPKPPKVVAVSGASNVTGIIPDIAGIAEVAHRHGAVCVVDGAQLVPHRAVDIASLGVDAIAFSGHKMYAPYGAGAVVARREVLAGGSPLLRGGGMARSVTLEEAVIAEPPASDEAGSPNVVGVVALSVALGWLVDHGFDAVAEHDRGVCRLVLEQLDRLDGVRVLGPTTLEPDRTAIVAFEIDGADHDVAAAALAYEHGIGVRAGKFCAHPFVDSLTGAGGSAVLRMSAGLTTSAEDIERFVGAVASVAAGEHRSYVPDEATGELVPADGDHGEEEAFLFRDHLATPVRGMRAVSG